MPRVQRERKERTDNYHLLIQWCRTPEQRLYEQIRPEMEGKLRPEVHLIYFSG